MIQAPDLPLWAALITAVLVVAGAAMTLLGAFGLVRLRSFYERMHTPTLGSTGGMAMILLASMLSLSLVHGRLVLHEVLIAVMVTVTAPVTLILLIQAARFRDRMENDEDLPSDDA